MYELLRGPLTSVAFVILIGGVVAKLLLTARLARREKTVFPTLSFKHGLISLVHWAVPFGSRNMRQRPVLTLVSWAFHLCLIVTPCLVMGHAVLWEESWGVRWWSLPTVVADAMTLVVVAGGLFLFLRRLVAPEVRNVTTWKDLVLLLVVIAPFATGFVAHQQWLPYEATLILHIAAGILWLVAIPFTWLAHVIWFLFSRAYMGSEFGAVRNARDW